MCLFIRAHFNHNQAIYNKIVDDKELLSPKLAYGAPQICS